MTQLHRKFTDEQVKELIEKYLRKEVGRRYLQEGNKVESQGVIFILYSVNQFVNQFD